MFRRNKPLPPLGRTLWNLTAVVTFGPLLAQMDTAVVNVALSTLSDELRAPLSMVQWVATSYLLALALMIPLTGWLIDMFGAKRVYIACFSMFTVASLLCGFATSVEALIAFRVVQGMAGGLLAPMAQLMVARHAGPNMTRVLAIIGIPVLIAPIFAPFAAGSILHFASWHWLFFMNVPTGLLAIVLAIYLLPPDNARRPRPLDIKGFLLISPGLVFLLDGSSRLATSRDHMLIYLGELGLGVALLVAFGLRGWPKGKENLLDLHLFAIPAFLASAFTQFLANATVFGGQMLFPLYFLIIRGMTPSYAGLILSCMGIGLMANRFTVDPIVRALGPRYASALGALFCLVPTIPFVFIDAYMSDVMICLVLVVRGFGMGMINMPSAVSAYSSVPKSSLTDAATALNIVQRLGGPVATVALVLFLQLQMGNQSLDSLTDANRQLFETAFHYTFAALCLINTLGLLCALRLPRTLATRDEKGA